MSLMMIVPSIFRSVFGSVGVVFILVAWVAASSCAPAIQEPSAPSPTAASDSTTAPAATPEFPSRRRGAVSIVEVYGARSPAIGEASDYRLRLAPGFEWPIQYAWDFGDGTAAVGNNVTHAFDQAGRYFVEVVARNRVSADTARFTVTVGPAPIAQSTVSESPEPFAAPPPFESGDLVWITNAHERREAAEAEVAVFTQAGFRSSVVPSHRYGGDVYYVAVGGYEDEDEALRARARVLRTRSSPLWLLRLGPSHEAN